MEKKKAVSPNQGAWMLFLPELAALLKKLIREDQTLKKSKEVSIVIEPFNIKGI